MLQHPGTAEKLGRCEKLANANAAPKEAGDAGHSEQRGAIDIQVTAKLTFEDSWFFGYETRDEEGHHRDHAKSFRRDSLAHREGTWWEVMLFG